MDTHSILGLKAGESSDNSGVCVGGSHGRVLACHVRPWVPSRASNKSQQLQLDILKLNSKRQTGARKLALDSRDTEGHWVGDHTGGKD